ncbi:hypothetical protein [Glycomyces sp. MUSA5-2]|uniref:hypothetical protein n=1 Tax=Glycomyces sp. MUSA5-2 TaxID=2053002 RepID=UPI0030099930
MSKQSDERRHRRDPQRVLVEFGDVPWSLAVETTDKSGVYALAVRRVGDALEVLATFATDDKGNAVGLRRVSDQFRKPQVEAWAAMGARLFHAARSRAQRADARGTWSPPDTSLSQPVRAPEQRRPHPHPVNG